MQEGTVLDTFVQDKAAEVFAAGFFSHSNMRASPMPPATV